MRLSIPPAPALLCVLLATTATPAGAAVASADSPAETFTVILQRSTDRSTARVTADAVARARSIGVQITHEYAALGGYSGRFTPGQLTDVRRDAEVETVARAGVAHGAARLIGDKQGGTQSGPPSWGLDRIDQRSGLDQRYSYTHTGKGVHAYVLDSGMRPTHRDYAGRVGVGKDFIGKDDQPDDEHGHGTHVSAIVGGTKYGVAKGVTLHHVRVLDRQNNGPDPDIIAGMDWVLANHVKPAVVNMSLRSGKNEAMDAAVRRLHEGGVVVVVATGNDSYDGCYFSPGREPKAITVAGSSRGDGRLQQSNYGKCIDLNAPSTDITSAGMSGDDAYANLMGTSQASPHVAGVAALYLEANPQATPDQIAAALVKHATSGALNGLKSDTPNLLVYSQPGPIGP